MRYFRFVQKTRLTDPRVMASCGHHHQLQTMRPKRIYWPVIIIPQAACSLLTLKGTLVEEDRWSTSISIDRRKSRTMGCVRCRDEDRLWLLLPRKLQRIVWPIFLSCAYDRVQSQRREKPRFGHFAGRMHIDPVMIAELLDNAIAAKISTCDAWMTIRSFILAHPGSILPLNPVHREDRVWVHARVRVCTLLHQQSRTLCAVYIRSNQ